MFFLTFFENLSSRVNESMLYYFRVLCHTIIQFYYYIYYDKWRAEK